MNSFELLFPDSLYHSYVIEGDPEETPNLLKTYFEDRNNIVSDNSDMFCQSYDSFTINDSQEVKDWHSKLGINDKKRICIIGAKFINHEAQQSLLKVIEEPHSNNHFFIVVPNSSLLLDTIISRTHLIKVGQSTKLDLEKSVSSFIKDTPAKRIEYVGKLIEDSKKNETSGGLRFQATLFINELEKYVYQKFKINKNDTQVKFVLDELQKSRIYMSTPGASVKMILEHIALML